jgi:hypothetical protein
MNENEEKDKTTEESRPKSWWKRKEVWSSIGLVVLNTAGHSLVATISPTTFLVANAVLGILGVTGIIQGVDANNLGLTKKNYKIGNE